MGKIITVIAMAFYLIASLGGIYRAMTQESEVMWLPVFMFVVSGAVAAYRMGELITEIRNKK